MEAIITESLQSTVRENLHIDNVYFDESGKFYFNVHRLCRSKEDKDKSKWELYGSGLESHREKIPGSELWGVRGDNGISEVISKGDPKTLIVSELSREEILSAKAKPEGKSITAQVANMTPEEKKALIELLGGGKAGFELDGE